MKIKRHLNIRSNYEGEIGIEIEMEGNHLVLPAVARGIWRAEGDGSLRGNEAIEYVLRKPAKRENLRQKLALLQKSLEDEEADLDATERCGVHVHIDCRDLTYTQVFNFGLLYLLFEEILLEFCGDGRQNNLFCLSGQYGNGLLMELKHARKTAEPLVLMDDHLRYASLNFSSLRKYGTLEFRGFRSTEKLLEIADWAELLLCLKDEATQMKDLRHVIENVSQQGAFALLEMVFKDKADLLTAGKNMLSIERDVLSGARRIQNVCYTRFDENVLDQQFEARVRDYVQAFYLHYSSMRYDKKMMLTEFQQQFFDCDDIIEDELDKMENRISKSTSSIGSDTGILAKRAVVVDVGRDDRGDADGGAGIAARPLYQGIGGDVPEEILDEEWDELE